MKGTIKIRRKNKLIRRNGEMSKSTHKTEYRILAGLLSLVCLLSFVFGSVPKSYADPLPVNVNLFLRDGSGETATE